MKETNCFPGTDGQRSSSQEEQLETLRRVYRWTLCNRGWCLLCLGLGTIISWSVDCRTLSGSWSSTQCGDRRHDRWRRPDDTNCSKLSGANFPWANFAFAYISPAYVTARGWSSLTHTGRSCRERSHRLALPTFPRVITALRFNSAAGTSDSADFCVDAAHRARYRNLPLPWFLPKEDSFWHAGWASISMLVRQVHTSFCKRNFMRRELTTRAEDAMAIGLLLGGLFAPVLGLLLTKEMHVSCISAVGVMGDHQQVGELGLQELHWFRWLTPTFAAHL